MGFQSANKDSVYTIEALDLIQQTPFSNNDVYVRSNLTRLQVLYWVGQKMRPASPLFNAILSFAIKGRVDESRFISAFQILLRRSDALRSVIKEIDGVPQLSLLPEMPYQMEVIDFSTEKDPYDVYQAWAAKRAVIPFDLETKLFDCALVKIAEAEYIWYLNQHHIITDATSFMLIFRFLAMIYQELGGASTIAEIQTPSFLDYLEYEKSFRNSGSYQRALSHWETKFGRNGTVPAVQRFNRRRKSTRVKRVSLALGFERSTALHKASNAQEIFAASREMTLYNLFAGLFCVLLYKMTGDTHPGFVTPVHNRMNEKFRQMIGLIMELCPIQIKVSEEDTYHDVIKKMRRETRESLSYYWAGLDIPATNGLSDVMFNMHPFPALLFDNNPVEVRRLHPGHGNESLALHVNEMGEDGNFVIHFDFHEDVFSEENQQKIVFGYLDLIDGFLLNPDQVISQVGEQFGRNIFHDRPAEEAVSKLSPPPRTILENQLLQIWEENLGIRHIGIKDNYFALGGSSLKAVHLFTRIQELTGRSLPLSTLFRYPTIEDLAEVIQKVPNSKEWSPLVRIKGGDGRRPFFCVHGAGGHALFCLNLARYIKPGQPFYAFQARGIEPDQIPYRYVEEMAASYVEELRRQYPEGPYLLGGYSMGGVVAYEMAQQLQAQGQAVALLAIIDVPAQGPGLLHIQRIINRVGRFLGLNAERCETLFLGIRGVFFRLRYFRDLEASEKAVYALDLVKANLRRLFRRGEKPLEKEKFIVEGNESAEIDDQRIKRVYAINERAFRLYVPRKYSGSVALFRSSDGYQDFEKDYSSVPDLGWGKVVQGKIESYVIPGNHYQIIRDPYVRQLGEQLNRCISLTQEKILNQPEGMASQIGGETL